MVHPAAPAPAGARESPGASRRAGFLPDHRSTGGLGHGQAGTTRRGRGAARLGGRGGRRPARRGRMVPPLRQRPGPPPAKAGPPGRRADVAAARPRLRSGGRGPEGGLRARGGEGRGGRCGGGRPVRGAERGNAPQEYSFFLARHRGVAGARWLPAPRPLATRIAGLAANRIGPCTWTPHPLLAPASFGPERGRGRKREARRSGEYVPITAAARSSVRSRTPKKTASEPVRTAQRRTRPNCAQGGG